MSTDTGAPRLPGGFRDLERWVEKWVCADSQARSDERQATPFDEIKAFYDAMLPQAVAALAHLSNYPMGALPPEEGRLLKLMLSLAEVAPAVEWYGTPKVVDGFPASRFPAVQAIPDLARQGRD